MSEENLEAPNPFNQAQLQSNANDSLNFESNFWKEQESGAYDNSNAYTNPSNAYDDNVQQQVQEEHKPNAITSLFNNMKQKLNENINKPSDNTTKKTESNGNIYGNDNAYGVPYEEEVIAPTKPSTKDDKSANLLSTNQVVMSHEELDRKEQYLDQKEKQLLERKKRLNAVKQELTSGNIRRDNWPCSYYPITFHSIQQEIPPHARSHMKRMYTLVLLTFLSFFCNAFAGLALYFNGITNDMAIFLSVIYFAVGVCYAWRMWYRQIYYGIRDRKNLKWWAFFIFFSIHIGFAIVMSIGFKGTGGAGMVTMINAFQKHKNFSGFVCLITTILWTMVSLGSAYYLKKSWVLFKQGGGSVEAGKGELANAVARHAAEQLV